MSFGRGGTALVRCTCGEVTMAGSRADPYELLAETAKTGHHFDGQPCHRAWNDPGPIPTELQMHEPKPPRYIPPPAREGGTYIEGDPGRIRTEPVVRGPRAPWSNPVEDARQRPRTPGQVIGYALAGLFVSLFAVLLASLLILGIVAVWSVIFGWI